MATVLTEWNAHCDEVPSAPRPKVLFFAYYFPPLNSIACVRTWNIAKYLSRLGWEVTVITPDPRLWRKRNDSSQVDSDLHRVRVQRILTGHRWRCLSPGHLKCWDGTVGWLLGGVCRKIARHLGIEMTIGWEREAKAACAALSPKDVDVILASGPPFVSFRLAKYLSARLGRPYVLDYRDPWVDICGSNVRNQRVTRNEQSEIIKASSAVTVVSPSVLKWRFNLGSNEHVISNGFDPEELRDVTPHDFGHFAIVYAGVFYPPMRVITPVMAALKRLAETYLSGSKETREWKFHYFGPEGDHVLHEARAFGITDKVCIHGRVSRGKALSAVRGAGVCVVIASVFEEMADPDRYIVPGKLFEALGLGTPVLFIGPSGSDADAVTEATGLVRKLPAKDVEGLATFFQEVMSGKIPVVKRLDTYAWPNLIRGFDNVLRQVIRRNTGSR